MLNPWGVLDFKGGMTDYYVGAASDRCQLADNMLIEKQGNIGKLIQRPGSEVFSYGSSDPADTRADQIPAGSQRIGALYYLVTFGGASLNSKRLFYISATKMWHLNQSAGNGSFVEAAPPTGGAGAAPAFPSDTVNSTYSITYFKDTALISSSAGQPLVGTRGGNFNYLGMPDFTATPVATGGTPGATFSYIYRFDYKGTSNTGGTARGGYKEITATNNTAIAAGAANTIAWTGITAAGTTNYPTATKEIYRTANGGTVFYLVTSLADATTTYSDVMPDATLILQEPMYTEGGSPESRKPPAKSIIHSCASRTYYGAGTAAGGTSSTTFPQRLYQSITGAPDYVPADYFIELDQAITGISSAKDVPIVMGDRGNVYRIEGFIDDLGGGDMVPVLIATNASCISHMGVVQASGGIFWPGAEGFFYSDGYNVLMISEGLRKTYKTFTDTTTKQRRIVGTYHEGENRIYWTAQVGDTATDCNYIFVLDLNWPISPDMPFTTWSGGTNFAPTALTVVDVAYTNFPVDATLSTNELMLVRGDTRGYALRHKHTLTADHKIDTAVGAGNALTLWGYTAIIYNYISAATDFGARNVRKWVPSMSVTAENEGNLSLQINSINDDGRITGSLKKIRFRTEYTGVIDEFRRFPARGLRCEFKQVQFTNAYVVITNSTTLGESAVVSGAANTATLSVQTWPTQSLEYYIAFANDSYVTEYLITGRTSSVLTFTDTGNVAPTGTYAWVIRGKPRNEIFHLQSYNLNYSLFSDTQTAYHATTTGEP